MKERITMQRLMQEGWIPVLIGILSASVIVSLAHSTGMAVVTAFLLMALYFVAIAANRVNARDIVVLTAKWMLQQTVQKISEVLCSSELDDIRRNALAMCSRQVDLTKNCFKRLISLLIDQIYVFGLRIESTLAAFSASARSVDSGGLVMLKNSKMVIAKLIHACRSGV